MKLNPLKTLKLYQQTSRALSLEEIADDLEQISKIKKCAFCGCNADTLREFEMIAKQEGRADLAEQARVLREGINKRYECIGCNPCYPADISNLLFSLDTSDSVPVHQSRSCDCTRESTCGETENWTVEKGDYLLGNPQSCVAVCTLASTELPELINSEMPQQVAIVGYCETENIGVEKVVKNIIANPYIRYLVLCGRESGKDKMGHFSGQAILSLHSGGISEHGRIIGAKGKRPVLKNVTLEQVSRFQSQVELVDLIGETARKKILETLNVLLSRDRSKFDGNATDFVEKDLIVAENPKRLVLDKKGFFVILPQKAENRIYVEYYANSGELLQTVVGTDAPSIYYTLISNGFVSKLDHAAYLGKELTRAEYFLKYGIAYTQDKALGELEVE